MSAHKFKIGDSVAFARRSPTASTGAYKVVGLLPTEAGECSYRIKSAIERHDRVVKEGEVIAFGTVPASLWT